MPFVFSVFSSFLFGGIIIAYWSIETYTNCQFFINKINLRMECSWQILVKILITCLFALFFFCLFSKLGWKNSNIIFVVIIEKFFCLCFVFLLFFWSQYINRLKNFRSAFIEGRYSVFLRFLDIPVLILFHVL